MPDRSHLSRRRGRVFPPSGRATRFRIAALAGLATLAAALIVAALLPARSLAVTPRVHAIVGARIVPAPGQVIERGTIVMRDGVIVAVGANVSVPADARIWNGDSLTVYAGLIDPFVTPAEPPPAPGTPPPGRPTSVQPAGPPRGAAHELSSVHPETRVVESLPLAKDQLEALRAAGFAAAQIAPRRGIVRGQSAVTGLADGEPNAWLIAPDAAQVMSIEGARESYPASLMGGIAVIRQSFLDARWYREAHAIYDKSPNGKQPPETNVSWEALQPVVRGTQPVWFVASDMLEVLRAASIAREAGIKSVTVTGGDDYKRAKEIAATGMSLVVPVRFPDAPDVSNPDLALEVSTEELRAWNDAPGNPQALAKQGIEFSLTANGLKDVKTFRSRIAQAIERGWKADQALAAVTVTPAKQLGLANRLGTIAPGKIANLTVTRGDLFAKDGKVREVWIAGERYEAAKDETTPKGKWTLGSGATRHGLKIGTEPDTSVTLVVGADSLKATNVRLEDKRARFTVRRGGEPGEEFDLSFANDAITGTISSGGGSHAVTGQRVAEDAKAAPKKDEPVVTPVVMGNTEAWRAREPEQPAAVLVRGATVWTAGPAGILDKGDVLIRAGKIAAVGKSIAAPTGAVVIDGTGKHIAPGIIDCHSHSAILGNVNEGTNSVTAEVRIRDVVNSESPNIYRQLAGGTTIMHLLHGSANAIGGQCAVIKNRWGLPPDQLLYAPAPQTIKFALGENPKQSNWGIEATGRYPQTRAGVEQVIRDAFLRARDYRAQKEEYKAGKRPYPPKPDLQLDALVEILESKRFVHCHSYRQDEILMLMRLAESFGFRVQTFQHVLEGYKIADEMATHGAGGSTFSDWWAYKYEVIDAIPYNGYLMWDRGVTVSYNSDSDDLARRLNVEAGKAIKYGGVPPNEALKFVTLNPAKQLRIDDRVGSLEVGKEADFTIWDGPPMSPYSACEQTWIEGRKYFDRAADLAARPALEKEREELIARARKAKKAPGDQGAKPPWPPRYLDASDTSGNACGDEDGHAEFPFRSEAARRELTGGEVQR
jgi:imidazolonepropionase-like amidohydrolase